MVDFADSPAEQQFRLQLRAWLADHNPHLGLSSVSDAYWEGQPAWHRSLYDAGYFGLSWPEVYGGRGRSPVYDVIVDEELAAAGAPPRPHLGYLVQGLLRHGSDEINERLLPGMISGRERWCQGFSEPQAGSDLASLNTRAVRDGDEYVVAGHKIWTSNSDAADYCFLLARTEPERPRHKGLSVLAVPMRQPGVEQRPIRMINGVRREFGEVAFEGARVPAKNIVGQPGEGWAIAMTVVSFEREPHELGFASRYSKTVRQLIELVRTDPLRFGVEQRRQLAWAIVEAEMLQRHVSRRLSDRLGGVIPGPEGSVDKLLMTSVEQAVGRACLSVGGADYAAKDSSWLNTYLYSRAQSVMGGTAQIQRNLVAGRLLGLPVVTEAGSAEGRAVRASTDPGRG